MPFIEQPPSLSLRPFLIRAIHEWCTEKGYTPYIAVKVDETVAVPRQFVKNDDIVLNISLDATHLLDISGDVVLFKARFGGVPYEISVPMARITAIYARENGQGLGFQAVDVPKNDAKIEKVHDAGVSSTKVNKQSSVLQLVRSQDVVEVKNREAKPKKNLTALSTSEKAEEKSTSSPTKPTLRRIK